MRNAIRAAAISATLFFGVTAALAQQAGPTEGVALAQKCELMHNVSQKESCQFMRMADGEPRGLKSPAALISRARDACTRGERDEAMMWTVQCHCPDGYSMNKIRSDRRQVLAYLGCRL
ncbi:MAG: hypothetical protein JNK11_08050 [Alphaproteobacteria bacterium]|nr:hypothetical protein [Alphaproteobacteria bacterium]